MSFRKTTCLVIAAVTMSATAAFAQAGGADVPGDAKAQGTKENGSSSTGMSKGEADAKTGGSMQKGGSMEKSGGAMKKGDGKM